MFNSIEMFKIEWLESLFGVLALILAALAA
jgi:hypothetical protein